jgi:hypothetical protein
MALPQKKEKRIMRSSIRGVNCLGVVIALAAFVVLAGLCVPAFTKDGGTCPGRCEKGNPNPNIMPPQSKLGGKSYGEWAAACWQWVFSIPADRNPILDTTGEDAAVGQSGNVWFLIGTWAGPDAGPVVRRVTVPTGKALFFPIFNAVWVNTPETEADWEVYPDAKADAIDWCRDYVDAAIEAGLSCEIDGRAVRDIASYRCQAPNFAVNFPEDNVWQNYGVLGGIHPNSIDDGVYLMLAPLPPGEHTVHFKAEGAVEVTYHITVTNHCAGR